MSSASAAVEAARRAEQSAAAVAALFEESEERGQGSQEGSICERHGCRYSLEPLPFPPAPNKAGEHWCYAFAHPTLPDGIYTPQALRNRGVDPDKQSTCLNWWKGAEGPLRAATTHAYQVDRITLW